MVADDDFRRNGNDNSKILTGEDGTECGVFIGQWGLLSPPTIEL